MTWLTVGHSAGPMRVCGRALPGALVPAAWLHAPRRHCKRVLAGLGRQPRCPPAGQQCHGEEDEHRPGQCRPAVGREGRADSPTADAGPGVVRAQVQSRRLSPGAGPCASRRCTGPSHQPARATTSPRRGRPSPSRANLPAPHPVGRPVWARGHRPHPGAASGSRFSLATVAHLRGLGHRHRTGTAGWVGPRLPAVRKALPAQPETGMHGPRPGWHTRHFGHPPPEPEQPHNTQLIRCTCPPF